MRQKLDRLLRDLPEESLPPVLQLVEGLSHRSQRQTEARSGEPPSRKKTIYLDANIFVNDLFET